MTESPKSQHGKLSALIFPMGKENLSQLIETGSVGHFKSSSVESFRQLLDIHSVSENLSKGMYPNDRFKVYMQGNRVPPEAYRSEDGSQTLDQKKTSQIFAGNASFVIDGFDDIDGQTGRLTHFIELEMGVRCWANFYCTKGKGGVLHRHYDDHDVLALQLEGKKRWYMGGKKENFPLEPFSERDTPPDDYPVQKEMEEGDVLFVPRGEWHWTENLSSTSMHVAFSLRGLTGVELVKLVARKSVSEENFRTYLPSWRDEKDFDASLTRFREELIQQVEQASLNEIIQIMDLSRRRGLKNEKVADESAINEETVLRVGIRRKVKPSVFRRHLFGPDFFDSTETESLVDAIVETLYEHFELSVSEMRRHLEGAHALKIEPDNFLDLITVLHRRGLIYVDRANH